MEACGPLLITSKLQMKSRSLGEVAVKQTLNQRPAWPWLSGLLGLSPLLQVKGIKKVEAAVLLQEIVQYTAGRLILSSVSTEMENN